VSAGIVGWPRHRSLWLREALLAEGEKAAGTLVGAQRADVAIVGGGYVGLWTALRLKEREPSCDVAIVEQDICGGGASGRNGGQVHAWWESLGALIRICGTAEAVRLAYASQEAVEEVATLPERWGIDAHVRRGGWLWTATTPAQVGAWEQAVRLCEEHGITALRRLPSYEVARRTGSAIHLAGIVDPGAITVQPGLLVRGLRRVALERGVRIYEQSRVTALDRGRPAVLRTPRGVLAAESVVLATNAWAAALPEFHRLLYIVSSAVVATAPVPERLAAIGWTGQESICDSQQRVLYYQATPDGRVVLGRGGGRVAFGGRIGAAFERDPDQGRDAGAALRRVYPMLADVAIEYDWAGPIDRSYSGLPLFGRLGGRPHIVYGVGWSGTGVAQSALGGRILSSLALGRRDEWSECGLVEQRPRLFPPEPIRYAGATIVLRAVRKKGEIEDRGERPNRAIAALAALTPGDHSAGPRAGENEHTEHPAHDRGHRSW
jgi:glycine/D-amino acid oxidase-like deaminating enzyme